MRVECKLTAAEIGRATLSIDQRAVIVEASFMVVNVTLWVTINRRLEHAAIKTSSAAHLADQPVIFLEIKGDIAVNFGRC